MMTIQDSASKPATADLAREDVAVTERAKSFYAALAEAKLPRAELTPELNKHITDNALAIISRQLHALGEPKFRFVKRVQQPNEIVSLYTIGTKQAELQMAFGVNADNKISVFFIGPATR